MLEILQYTFMQKALLAGLFISLTVGLFGPYLVLRRLSLLGDGLAHLAFGGIALGLLFGVNPLLAALISAIVGAFFVHSLIKKEVYGEATIALILSFGVGLGVLIIGMVRGFTIDLFSFLIGSILTINNTDLILIFLLFLITCSYVVYFRRELLLLSFNQTLAKIKSKKTIYAEFFFPFITALIVVVSIRAVGILLVTALIVLPALISMTLVSSFKQTLLMSMIISTLGVIIGIILAYVLDAPPSGVIVMSLFVLFLFAGVYAKFRKKA